MPFFQPFDLPPNTPRMRGIGRCGFWGIDVMNKSLDLALCDKRQISDYLAMYHFFSRLLRITTS